jgi:osmotically-inducible protein OsmY
MEFCPADVSDEQIVADARESASRVLGSALAAQLEYYCEDHFLKIYGKLPSLAVREQLEEAVRSVPGVGLYDVACEVVLERPPSDDRVVVGVRRKLRRPFELPNLTFRAHQIEVRSVNNVVYLSGQAPTLLGKLSAASQAAQVDGVRYVVNRIRVPGRPPTQPSPGPSAEAALNSAVTPGDAAERVELVAPSPQTWANPEGQLGATTSDDPPALPETEL